MNDIAKLNLVKQIYNYNEQIFINYINNNSKYPFKSDFLKFMIVDCKVEKDILTALFDGFLKDMLIFKCSSYYIIIYHNKERIKMNNYIESLSEDVGQLFNVFEGFNIYTNKINLFIDFISIYNKYFINDHLSYMTISDVILKLNNKYEEIKYLKQIVLDKFLLDNEFEKLVKALFSNNLNVSKTANVMYMHRNTINNKLVSLENETTLSIQKFKDAVALYELLK